MEGFDPKETIRNYRADLHKRKQNEAEGKEPDGDPLEFGVDFGDGEIQSIVIDAWDDIDTMIAMIIVSGQAQGDVVEFVLDLFNEGLLHTNPETLIAELIALGQLVQPEGESSE